MTILTAAQVATLCHQAGFAGEALVTAVAVAKAESGFDTEAVGDTTLTDGTWGPSVGLFQVRCLNAQRGTGGIRDEFANADPEHNARSAWAISAQGTSVVRGRCSGPGPTVATSPKYGPPAGRSIPACPQSGTSPSCRSGTPAPPSRTSNGA